MLKHVLLRLDYTNPISGYRAFLPKPLNDQIVRLFPIAEPREIGFPLQIANPSDVAMNLPIREWNYFNASRTEHFCVTETALIYETQTYNDFNVFTATFTSILEKFIELNGENGEFVFSRIGLRYVNVIENSSREALSANSQINESLKVNISPSIILPEKMSRNMSIVEYQEDEFNVKVQYGYFNTDYPAKIVKWDFTLDVDASKQGLIYYEDIASLLNKMHISIKSVYSTSIGD